MLRLPVPVCVPPVSLCREARMAAAFRPPVRSVSSSRLLAEFTASEMQPPHLAGSTLSAPLSGRASLCAVSAGRRRPDNWMGVWKSRDQEVLMA